MKNFEQIEKESINFLCQEKSKEWKCHVQFVKKISIALSKTYGGNKQTLVIASILHDIGRDKEINGEDHRTTGAKIAINFLKNFNLSSIELDLIIRCITNHGGEELPTTLEEKILITADSASKLLYHQAFMLMCKKVTYIEKAEWGLKYIEKGYKKIQFKDYKKMLTPIYKKQKKIYLDVLTNHHV